MEQGVDRIFVGGSQGTGGIDACRGAVFDERKVHIAARAADELNHFVQEPRKRAMTVGTERLARKRSGGESKGGAG